MTLHKQTLPRVLKKNLNKDEARNDINAFAVLEGNDGDRLIEHLALKFKVFEHSRNKTLFEAGYDEGVRAMLTYIETLRLDYGKVKQRLEETNG